MKKYFIKTPWWLKKIYNRYTWSLPTSEKILYLSFDDGPHPTVTPFVLDTLQQYQAKATFFCIGKNVAEQHAVYKRILDEGHAVGNHTHNHYNGWKTDDKVYIDNILEAAKWIDSTLFRPPYGRISGFQARNLQQLSLNNSGKKTAIIMWDVLSADFDTTISGEDCLKNVLGKATNGSIIVFHDSEKAFSRLEFTLPRVLAHFHNLGYSFRTITMPT